MTTNFPNGISTADRGTELERLILPDPTQAHVYFNDFTTYVAGDWTITTTEGGTGNASEALTNVAGGALLITNDDADNDSVLVAGSDVSVAVTNEADDFIIGSTSKSIGGMTIANSSTGYGSINFSDATSGNGRIAAYIAYDHNKTVLNITLMVLTKEHKLQ